jgi:hypothetical protein
VSSLLRFPQDVRTTFSYYTIKPFASITALFQPPSSYNKISEFPTFVEVPKRSVFSYCRCFLQSSPPTLGTLHACSTWRSVKNCMTSEYTYSLPRVKPVSCPPCHKQFCVTASWSGLRLLRVSWHCQCYLHTYNTATPRLNVFGDDLVLPLCFGLYISSVFKSHKSLKTLKNQYVSKDGCCVVFRYGRGETIILLDPVDRATSDRWTEMCRF